MNLKKNSKDSCPDIGTLIKFVMGKQEGLWINEHITACELCKDLTEGIDALRKEDMTPEEFSRHLMDNDEAYLKTLKFHENPNDLISEITTQLDLPDFIEERIRKALRFRQS